MPGKKETLALKNGFEYELLSEEDTKKVAEIFPTFDSFMRFKMGNWLFPATFGPALDNFYNMECRSSDVYVASLAKSGTTWTLEIIWTLVHNPDLKNEEATRSLDSRIPYIEADMLLNSPKVPGLNDESELIKYMKNKTPEKFDKNFPAYSLIHATDDPRILKTHLPAPLLPKNAIETSKVIYVVRDPRDVILSKVDFNRKWVVFNYTGSLDDFINSYISDNQFTQPSWMHIKSYFDLRDHPNVLVIYYEDLKADAFKEISKISDFLGLKRTTEQLKNVVEYTSFSSMKKRSDEGITDQPCTDGGRLVNKEIDGYAGFFRQGKAGKWKESYDEDQKARINAWMETNMKMFPEDFKYRHMN